MTTKHKKNKAARPVKKIKAKAPKEASDSVKASAAKADEVEVVVKKGKTPSLLRGMKDRLPKEEWIWHQLYDEARRITAAYGFGEIETPILEEASLFIRSIGRGTDVVDKEMYVFEDRDLTKVGLRPEATASIARSYIMHGLYSLPQPVKFWQYGPMFRHDRPQAGRYREFHQFDCEVIGERDPIIDAELIVVAYNFLRDLGIDVHIDINSIGSPADRERYLVELTGYLRTKRSYLCEDCKKRMVKNPLRVFDCKEASCAPVIEEAPQIIDWLSEASKNYFMKVLEYLDELSVPYMLRSTLVRGLDYYTDTVFELYADIPASIVAPESVPAPESDVEAGANPERGSQAALGGGGRYDGLLEQLGGRPTPACGFAIGLERVASILRMRAAETGVYGPKKPQVFLAQLGEQARRRSLYLIEELRREGIVIQHNLGKPSLKTQLELANKVGATHTLIIGQKEVQDGTVIIRDMESGIQETVDQKKIRVELEKLLRGVQPLAS